MEAYAISPLKMDQISSNTVRIEDAQKMYALKRSALTKESIENWEHVLHQAKVKNIVNVLPVYLTKQGHLYKEIDGTIFYLTPWIKAGKFNVKQLYQSIGRVHAATKVTYSVETENMNNQFHTYMNRCEEAQQILLHYLGDFEKVRYMSPFELLVCTQYKDLELILKENQKRVKQFLEEFNRDPTWNYCLCHGNLLTSHHLDVQIINWEKAHYENPIHDLAYFFNHEVNSYDIDIEALLESFSTYMKENELTLSELYLLAIYLLDTSEYITVVEQYINRNSSLSMINQVKALQRIYRRLTFGLRFSEYVGKVYDTIDLDDIES